MPVFVTLLTPPEWEMLKALKSVGAPTTAPVIHRMIGGEWSKRANTRQTLETLVDCTLATRIEIPALGPSSPRKQILFALNPEGHKLFPS